MAKLAPAGLAANLIQTQNTWERGNDEEVNQDISQDEPFAMVSQFFFGNVGGTIEGERPPQQRLPKEE